MSNTLTVDSPHIHTRTGKIFHFALYLRITNLSAQLEKKSWDFERVLSIVDIFIGIVISEEKEPDTSEVLIKANQPERWHSIVIRVCVIVINYV